MSNVLLRVATLEDATAIQSIYAPYVENTAITFEEVVPSVEDGEVVGYAYAGRFSARAAFDWSTEVSIYISLKHQRKGYGKLLYAALEDKLLELGYQNIYACVAVPEVEDEYLTNNSLNYHQYLGFEICGRFKKCGCKFNRWYDIVWLQKHGATTIPTKRPNRFTKL